MYRSFHAGTQSTYKKEFSTSAECMDYMKRMYETFERDGHVMVRDVCPDKVTQNADWAWTSLNMVCVYQGGKVFEIKNKPRLLSEDNSISELHFRNDYTLSVLSQYAHYQTIAGLRDALRDRSLERTYGIGPVTVEDVRTALEEWYVEHGT